MNAVDTNILIYVHDPRDPAKQAVARALVESLVDGVLLWQVVCEFISASRKLERYGYDQLQAFDYVRRAERIWDAVYPDLGTLNLVFELMDRRSLAFWDALIIAVCLENDVKRLCSEDLDTHNGIDGLEIVNPFHEHR